MHANFNKVEEVDSVSTAAPVRVNGHGSLLHPCASEAPGIIHNHGDSTELSQILLPAGGTHNYSHPKSVENGQPSSIETEEETIKPLHYGVSETPPFHLLVFFALQQALLSVSMPLSVTVIVAEVVCAQKDEDIKRHVLSGSMLTVGVATFIMSTFGVRLPIFQGPTGTYLIPLLTMSTSPEWQCADVIEGTKYAADNSTVLFSSFGNTTYTPARDIIVTKIAQLSGSLMVVGVIHFLIGATGLVGVLMRYIGPVTIVPTIILVGLHIYKVVAKLSEPSWLVMTVTSMLNLTFSLFLANKLTPIPLWTPSKGFHIVWYPLHQMFSVLLSLLIGWVFSGILTASGFFSDDKTSTEYLARTDAKGDIVAQSKLFEVPYPGKFGGFSFSVAGFTSYMVASLLSIFDSIGDYSACAKTARVFHPPKFAFNRGIAMEGLTTVLSGSLGCCHSTVSYGPNIGAMGITRVASRRVFQLCGLMYILASIIGKVGAVFITIPLPVLGANTLIMVGLFNGMVLSYLESISLRSTRNLAIIGIALLLGIMMPYWIANNPHRVNTGHEQFDMLIKILLSNPSFVGGAFACFMDNTVPGTLKERGLLQQIKELEGNSDDTLPEKSSDQLKDGIEIYRLPFLPMAFRKSKISKWIPLFHHIEKQESDYDNNNL